MPAPSLKLVALKTAQLESVQEFYTRLGFKFFEEQHGNFLGATFKNSLRTVIAFHAKSRTFARLIQRQTKFSIGDVV